MWREKEEEKKDRRKNCIRMMYREQQKKTIKLTFQAVINLVKKYNAAITHGTINIATK